MSTMEVTVPLKGAQLGGQLTLPPAMMGLVIFAHGSGSSRMSPRNQAVASRLNQEKLATFLFDLLTPEEEQAEAYTRHFRFNIGFLAERLAAATRWLLDQAAVPDVNVGYFGSSTGAAAALIAAADLRDAISAVVSRGGRPDLAGEALERVAAATLLIVGGDDRPVIPLNEEAYFRLNCQKALRIVPGASHLFEEPGTLDMVANMAAEWFAGHLHTASPRAT